jgi:hypothetical protein
MKEQKMRNRLYGETCEFHQRRYETAPRGYLCEWAVGGFACGPRLVFYMRHRHRRIKYIESWGMPKRYLQRASNDRSSPPAATASGCF